MPKEMPLLLDPSNPKRFNDPGRDYFADISREVLDNIPPAIVKRMEIDGYKVADTLHFLFTNHTVGELTMIRRITDALLDEAQEAAILNRLTELASGLGITIVDD